MAVRLGWVLCPQFVSLAVATATLAPHSPFTFSHPPFALQAEQALADCTFTPRTNLSREYRDVAPRVDTGLARPKSPRGARLSLNPQTTSAGGPGTPRGGGGAVRLQV